MVKPDHQTPVLEWIAAAAGAAALATVLGVIIFGLTTGSTRTPPTFAFETISISRTGERWHVAFKVTNSGDQAAAAVKVVGELASGTEARELTLRLRAGEVKPRGRDLFR